jgi:hypothetical protein
MPKGRPRDEVWEHYDRVDAKVVSCRYCHKKFSSPVSKALKGHLSSPYYARTYKTTFCEHVDNELACKYQDEFRSSSNSLRISDEIFPENTIITKNNLQLGTNHESLPDINHNSNINNSSDAWWHSRAQLNDESSFPNVFEAANKSETSSTSSSSEMDDFKYFEWKFLNQI